MSKFEFIMMFVSVVVAFAMSELLVGWGRLVRARDRISHPALMIGWSCWLLAMTNFHYIGFWEYAEADLRTPGQMLLFLAAPIMLVLTVFVFTPEVRYYQKVDLEQHYFRIKNWFFVTIIIFMALARASDPLLPDFAETWLPRMLSTIIIVPSLVVLLFTRRRRVHYAMLAFNLVLLLWSSTSLSMRSL